MSHDFLSANRRTTAALLEQNGPFYVIWNPGSSLPPSVMYQDEEHAWKVAERLASQNPDEKFFILNSNGHAVTTRPVIRKKVNNG